jgi:hypothetical protein
MLSAVKGIYLILDKSTGNNTLDLHTEKDGIFGRWRIMSIQMVTVITRD